MLSAVPTTILLPILDATSAAVLPLAQRLADVWRARLILLDVVTVAAEQPMAAGVGVAQGRRERLQVVARRGAGTAEHVVRVARSVDDGIREAVADLGVDLVLLGWDGTASSERLFGPPIEPLLAEPPCDLIVVRQQALPHGARILLPTNGGPQLGLSATLASALAGTLDGSVTVLVANDPQRPLARATLGKIQATAAALARATYGEHSAPALPALLDAAAAHDVVVIGATGRRLSRDFPVGPLGDALLAASAGTVMIVRHKLDTPAREAVRRFEAERDPAARVDKWFAQNTFSSDEFADLDRLLALKRRQGVSISLALPALNEAATLGPLLDALVGPLHRDRPLLDEIVLVDSHSTDATREIARSRGVPVYIHQQVLPHYGAFAGKGEALWKSLYVTTGDIVVWIDTDIQQVDPRFVYGLIGPLLQEPRLQFTKGFYRRPISVGGQLLEGGGGRVTELAARPLFNLFFPELAGFIQPLAGEYAARRSVLERLPFFTGYGVETGLLIDLLHTVGLGALAQVDLQQRVHRNQELQGLSRMAFAIMQVVIQRLEARQRLSLLDPVNQSLQLIRYADDGGLELAAQAIRDHERPPIGTLPEYATRVSRVPALAEP